MFVIGRGPEFATAREIALKLLETCQIAAEPLTATDLAHGPVAALDPLFPVWAVANDDESLGVVVEAAARVREAGATLIASGPAADAIADAQYRLPVPTPPSPLLAPLLSVVPGQLFAGAVARAKGLDPDRPRGLSKVTLPRDVDAQSRPAATIRARNCCVRGSFGAEKISRRRALLEDPPGVEEADAVRDARARSPSRAWRPPSSSRRAASSRTSSSTSPTSSGSSALVTSSSSSSFGFIASARRIATRCCWPPESRSG